MRSKIYILVAALVITVSCSSNKGKVYQQFKEVSTSAWHWKDSKSFDFVIDETGYYYNINLDLRITGSYSLSNIWLLYKTNGPSFDKENQVEIPLSDNTGKWLGKGQGNLLTYSKTLYPNIKLEKGTYRFVLSQNTREENLSGVSDIGISVIKTNKAL